MELHINFADKIDPVAVYAAIVATLVLGWQIFVWLRSGPHLKGRANSNMKSFGALGESNETYVVFNITNTGRAPTTITHVALYAYKNRWNWFRQRTDFTAIVNHSLAAYPIPYVFKVGETFMSMCIQTDDLVQKSKDMLLYGVVIHSFSNRPLLMRINPIQP